MSTPLVGLMAAAFALGATVWFFFVQAPFLLRRLGRERFVPIQMLATRQYGRALVVATGVMLAAAVADALTHGLALANLLTPLVGTAALATVAALVNARVLIPRAIKAGGRGYLDVRGHDSEASTASFAADGVGEATATMHRLVVLAVVTMLAGVVPHLILLGPADARPAQETGPAAHTEPNSTPVVLPLGEHASVKMVRITIAPGGVLPAHSTPVHATVAAMSGVGSVTIGQARHDLPHHGAVFLPKQVPHAVVNTGDTPLVILVHHLKTTR